MGRTLGNIFGIKEEKPPKPDPLPPPVAEESAAAQEDLTIKTIKARKGRQSTIKASRFGTSNMGKKTIFG